MSMSSMSIAERALGIVEMVAKRRLNKDERTVLMVFYYHPETAMIAEEVCRFLGEKEIDLPAISAHKVIANLFTYGYLAVAKKTEDIKGGAAGGWIITKAGAAKVHVSLLGGIRLKTNPTTG